MTERALRDMQLIAQYSKDPNHVKFANTVAGFLQKAHADGFPKSVSELGVTAEEAIREPRTGHSVIEVDSDLPVIRNKNTQESTRVRPPCAHLMRVFLQSPGLSLGNETLFTRLNLDDYSDPLGILKVHMSNLRTYLSKIGAKSDGYPAGFIITIHGIGFALGDPSYPQDQQRFAAEINFTNSILARRNRR